MFDSIHKKENTMNFDLEYIEKLVKMVSDSELTELTLEEKESAIVIRKEKEIVQAQTIVPQAIASAPVAAPAVASAPATTTEEKAPEQKGTPITSPMVGTFYAAPSPDAEPFVEVGKTIAEGDVVCIVEAMKLMNEIKAEHSGKVTQICVKNGDPVEFGQVLMYVE